MVDMRGKSLVGSIGLKRQGARLEQLCIFLVVPQLAIPAPGGACARWCLRATVVQEALTESCCTCSQRN